MLVKFFGKQGLKFKTEAGGDIEGTKIYVGFQEENVEGLRTDGFFVKKEIDIPEVKLGEQLDVRFNRHGKIEAIFKVTK